MLVFLIILLCILVYAVPGLIATGRHHPQAWRVWLVDIFLGFTVIGWLWALRDALRPDAVPHGKVDGRYGHDYEASRKKRFDVRQLRLGAVGVAVVGLVAAALAGTFGWRYFEPQPAANEAAAAAVAAVAAPKGWTYSVEDHGSGPVYVSILMSDDADTEGDHMTAALVLRSGAGEPSAAIWTDGHFTCSAAANGTIDAQFDGGPTETLHCTPRPEDTPNRDVTGRDKLFIANPQAFIARARTARSLVLTATLAGQGVKRAQFSSQGLDVAQAGLPQLATATVAAVKPKPEFKPAAKVSASAPPVKRHHAVQVPHRTRYMSWHE